MLCHKSRIFLKWGFLISSSITCTILMIYIGRYYSNVKYTVWMVINVLIFALVFFIYEPIRAVITALYITFIRKDDLPEIPTITIEDLNFNKNTLKDFKECCNQLFYEFKNKLYEPFSEEKSRILKKRLEQEKYFSDILSDLYMFLVYLLILTILILSSRNIFNYYSYKHIEDLLIHPKHHANYYQDMSTSKDIQEYLFNILTSTIHCDKNFDGILIHENGWLPGKVTRMLGVARLRQVRVKNTTCTNPFKHSNFPKTCHPEYSEETADKIHYSVGWTAPIPIKQAKRYWRIIEPWKFQKTSKLRTISTSGIMTDYSGDGYVSQLGRTKNNTNLVLNFLYNNKWIDQATKAIFIELNFYSVDVNLFNIVNLIFEKNAYGKWMTSYEIKTSRLLISLSDMSSFLIICFLIFVVITICFFVEIILRAFNAKLMKYLANAWNLIDVAILVLTVVYIAFFFKRSQYVKSLIEELEYKKNNEFVSFHWATLFDQFTTTLSGFLICIATVRLWKILNFALTFRMLSQTLSKSFSSLLSTTLLMGLILIGLCSCIYIINGSDAQIFNTPLRTVTSVTAFALGFTNRIEFDNLLHGGKLLGIALYFTLMLTINVYLLNMFITIVCVYFGNVKDEMKLLEERFNFWRYVKLRIRKFLNKPKESIFKPIIKIRHQDYSLSRAKFLKSVLDSHFNYLEVYLKQCRRKEVQDIIKEELQGFILEIDKLRQ